MGALSRLTGLDRVGVGSRMTTLALVGAGAAVSALLTLAFFAFALYLWLAPSWGAVQAAAFVGFIGFLVTVVLGLIATVVAQRTKDEMRAAVRASALVTFVPTALRFVSRRAGTMGALAAIATGFLVGRQR